MGDDRPAVMYGSAVAYAYAELAGDAAAYAVALVSLDRHDPRKALAYEWQAYHQARAAYGAALDVTGYREER